MEGDFTIEVNISKHYQKLYDQAGLFLFIDNENWVKCGIEHVDTVQQIGGVVTQFGFSDWSSYNIPANINIFGLRMHKRGQDIKLEASINNEWIQLRMFHLLKEGDVKVGVMACSPLDSQFETVI